MADKTATDQAQPGASPLNGVVPPKSRQFGQPNGNPRNPGGWKKADTARFKLEQMLKMSGEELQKIGADKNRPFFERRLAEAISTGNWSVIKDIINQVYGMPRSAAPEGTIQRPRPEDMVE